MMSRYISLLIVGLLPLMLCSCTTTGKNWKLNEKTGIMECVQEIELKGFGDREVKFEDKSQIESKSSKIFPDLKIDVDDLKTD